MRNNRLSGWGCVLAACLACLTPPARADWEGKVAGAPDGWSVAAPREEIRPEFAFEPAGGPQGQAAWVIEADQREGLDGAWVKTFPIHGGRCYRFSAMRKVENVALPWRSRRRKDHLAGRQGRRVNYDDAIVTGYTRGYTPRAEAEHPTDKAADARGWTEVSDTYHAPSKATQAVVELRLRWAAGRQDSLERGELHGNRSAARPQSPPGDRSLSAARRQDGRRQPPHVRSLA